MPRLRRFDRARLKPIFPIDVGARRCELSDALVAACRKGADGAAKPWAQLHVDDADVANRACLMLDGSWAMADASAVGRLVIRANALAGDLVRWRPSRTVDFWDAGWAISVQGLAGFAPRRPTLIVIDGSSEGDKALADLAWPPGGWRHAVRLVWVGPRPA